MANKRRRKPAGRPPGAVRTVERPAEGDGTATRRPPGAQARAAANQRNRAEKKELARRQREEVRRIVRRRERMRQGAWALGILAAVGVIAFLIFRPEPEAASTDDLPGLLRTEAPWDNNAADADERAELINLPAHGSTLAMHTHSNVQVFVHGTRQLVPVDIGIDGTAIASVHTHTSDGLVHVESSTEARFTLKQFFDIWGVRYTGNCLGAYCNDGTNRVQVFVDGVEVAGDVTDVELTNESVIVVTYGTAEELPDPIPTTFDFASIQA